MVQMLEYKWHRFVGVNLVVSCDKVLLMLLTGAG